MELLVALELVGGRVHGEDTERRVTAALGGDRGAHHHCAIDTVLVLYLGDKTHH